MAERSIAPVLNTGIPTGIVGSNPTLPARFWAKVDKTEGCWLWIAGSRGQYGSIKISGQVVDAHRVSWQLAYGAIPDGLCVCHKCDVPLCVRPDHLFLGTKLDNNRDMYAKGRGQRGDRSGLRLHPEAVIRGSKVKVAIFTEDLVRELRIRYRTGDVTFENSERNTDSNRIVFVQL